MMKYVIVLLVSASIQACGGGGGETQGGINDNFSIDEFTTDGSPDISDSDGDGLFDHEEIALGTDPFSRDTDGNGVGDADEDTDFDGMPNIREIENGSDPSQFNTGEPVSLSGFAKFPFGKVVLSETGMSEFMNLLDHLETYQEISSVSLLGHASLSGSIENSVIM